MQFLIKRVLLQSVYAHLRPLVGLLLVRKRVVLMVKLLEKVGVFLCLRFHGSRCEGNEEGVLVRDGVEARLTLV